ncbi:peptidoglycan DD-metalloendopeptidase family protein [Limibacillus halophilus]|uniref:peptidoglycan DD-metalloendopeptidase family protein n=1 Tax=Limibacillus halophilus TaxID=1579333 RepID=UPI001C84FDC8|nr:peptidoglycan DD-metalloendopeptidase family protein [Limibacillus halophilus]
MQEILRHVRAWVDRQFPEREIYLRAEGRVRFLRVSPRQQKLATGLAICLAGWGLAATVTAVVSPVIISEQQTEINKRDQAYVSLLNEIDQYYDQYTNILGGLEDNQSMLQDILSGQAEGVNLADIQARLNRSEGDHAKVVVARDALENKLASFESSLRQIAEQNVTLETQVTSMKSVLDSTKAEREEVVKARETLLGQLTETQERLTREKLTKQKLQANLEDISEDVVIGDAERQALIEKRFSLEAEIAALETRQRGAETRQTQLEQIIINLQESLDDSRDMRAQLSRERDELKLQVVSLEETLSAYEQRQLDLVAKLTERTLSSIGDIEKAVAMTGVEVDKLLNRVNDAPEGELGMGGPFVPLVGPELDQDNSFQTALALLDLHLRRWEGLRTIATALPLTPPMDSYELNSNYGPRKDPKNGKRAQHYGIDLGAPTGTPVFAPAPGKVVKAGWFGNYGRYIEIDHGFGVTTRYAHLKRIEVKRGETIDFRQPIGAVGSSGRSTGPHLHYEIRIDGNPLNPDNFLEAGRHVFKG